MKNNKILYTCLIVIAAVFLSYTVIDTMSGGRIGYLIENLFIYNDSEGNIFFNWGLFKQAMLISLIIISVLYAYFYEKNREKQKLEINNKFMNELKKALPRVLDSNEASIELPIEFKELETYLMQLQMNVKKQEQMYQIETQRKNDLITYLAHDLKTPLSSIIGYLSLMDEVKDMPSKQKEKYLNITLEKTYRLEELINEFFDITRFNLQNIVLQKEKLNINFLLEQMADEFYPMQKAQHKEIILDLEEDLWLYGDPNKLGRVLNNIIKNAMAYSYENTQIVINAKKEQDQIKIEIENEGKQIPEEKLNQIFEKFYRLDDARSSINGGAGLGLAIAKEIVEAHKGKIEAKSKKGKTIFQVYLPIEI